MFLSDTDCVIDFLKKKAPVRGAISRAFDVGELAINTVTAYELYFGEPTGPERERLDRFIGEIVVVTLSVRAAEFAAVRGRELELAGHRLETADLLIAGTALDLSLPLITRNVGHFGRIPGLVIQDPA